METKTIFLMIFLWAASVFCQADTGSGDVENCAGIENSYLWRIDVSPPIFLFGTMHVPYTKLWQFIPENVKTAFSSSEELCLELELLDDETLQKLSDCRILPSGTKIEDVLSAELISRITHYLDVIKEVLPSWIQNSGGSFLLGGAQTSEHLFQRFVGDWKQLRPVWILYLLGSLTEERARLNQVPVVDTFLERAAKGLGKGVEAVEEPEDQCRPFNKLLNHEVELALQVQLDFLEKLIENSSFNGPRSTMEDDISTYRCGDFSHLVNHTPLLPIPSLDNITMTSPYLTEANLSTLRVAEGRLYRQLVVKRNRKMAQQIGDLLGSERNKTFFLGLGAGHYLTEKNSVISRLRKKGHIIEHIPAHFHINGSSLPDNIVEIGDPSSVTGVLHIDLVETDPPPPPPSHGALDDSRLKDIFHKYLLTTSSTPSTTSPPPRQARSNIPTPALSRLVVAADTVHVEETSSMWQGMLPLLPIRAHSNSLHVTPISGAESHRGSNMILSLLVAVVSFCLVSCFT